MTVTVRVMVLVIDCDRFEESIVARYGNSPDLQLRRRGWLQATTKDQNLPATVFPLVN